MTKWNDRIIAGILFATISTTIHFAEAAAPYWNGDSSYPLSYTEKSCSIYLDSSSCDCNTEHLCYDLYTAGYMNISEKECHYLTTSFRLFKDGTDRLQVYDRKSQSWITIPNPITDMANSDDVVQRPIESALFKTIYTTVQGR